MNTTILNETGFCIYINTICHGAVPVERDGIGNVVVYSSVTDAQRVIAEATIERLRQFLEGEREYEDAMTVEEYIVEVDVLPDGSITDAAGNIFCAADLMN
jgi:hypothetical protein